MCVRTGGRLGGVQVGGGGRNGPEVSRGYEDEEF